MRLSAFYPFIFFLQDVQALAQDLPNIFEVLQVPVQPFNHLDFIWAVDAKVLVYDESLRILNYFNNNS